VAGREELAAVEVQGYSFPNCIKLGKLAPPKSILG